MRTKFGAAIFLLCVLLVGLAYFRWGNRESPPNILFITLDTTRADRIGAYGYENARTPVLDQLAREGVLFEHAVSPAPLTLPVHASLFTGLYPPEHGLRTNGVGSLPKHLMTFSEILDREGYDTAAFVASFVLDSKFGLARGFEEYDDDLAGAEPTQDAIHRYRDGGLVVDSALEWLNKSRSKPFFCWVHLYDPHAPYDPRREDFGDDFADSPYDGEIAYTDRQVGRLLDFLKAHPRTIVVLVGDHGESLGDHFELQHGYTLYSATQHVPLIMKNIPETVAGARVRGAVSLVDILPTLTEILNLSPPENISGRSFLPAMRGERLPPRACYGGTDDPFLQNGWSPLRSLTTDRWRYIRTSKPELYDLEADPRELNNLAETEPQRLEDMEGQLYELEAKLAVGKADEVQLSDAEQRALKALGYAAGSSQTEAPAENTLPDVKDMLPFNMRTQTAIDLMDQNKLTDAETLLRQIVADSPPEHFSSRLYLGSVLERKGQLEQAEIIYKDVLTQRPDDTNALFHLGSLYAEQGRYAEAANIFERSLVSEPNAAQPLYNLGLARARTGELDLAEQHFERVLQLDPAFPGAWTALGNLRARQGRTAEALAAYEYELRINPGSIEAHVNLGVQLGGQQKLNESREHLAEAVRLAPDHPDARFNLGICEEMLGDYDTAILHLKEAIRLRPDFPGVRTALGNVLIKAGKPTEAIEVYEAELARYPDRVEARVNLGAALAEQGQMQKAKHHLQKVLQSVPNHSRATLELDRLRENSTD